jgi:hypothetical protein
MAAIVLARIQGLSVVQSARPNHNRVTGGGSLRSPAVPSAAILAALSPCRYRGTGQRRAHVLRVPAGACPKLGVVGSPAASASATCTSTEVVQSCVLAVAVSCTGDGLSVRTKENWPIGGGFLLAFTVCLEVTAAATPQSNTRTVFDLDEELRMIG